MVADTESTARLVRAARVLRWLDDPEPPPLATAPDGPLFVGADLGTAYLTLVALDAQLQPLAGEYQYAEVARDGLVVDFVGAVERLQASKARLERRLGRTLEHAHSGYPPGVGPAEVRATANVLEAAGFICSGLTDEPRAANALLDLQDAAIVDVGGGTTGIAIVQGGEVVYTADEATGGTHFTLVLAGSQNVDFVEAERLKTDPARQAEWQQTLRPVMEKVASIARRHIGNYAVPEIVLVGGSSALPGMAEAVQEYTGIPARVALHPAFVTPLGFAVRDAQLAAVPG